MYVMDMFSLSIGIRLKLLRDVWFGIFKGVLSHDIELK